MAVKWTRKTRSHNWVQEQMRKKISDKTNFKPIINGRDMQRIIIAKMKRWSK